MPSDRPLRPDEPIRKHSQDLLDRQSLVEAIATQILAAPTDRAITIGLNGPWGTGKSSFLNLLENRLHEEEVAARPIIVRFNPWLFGNIEQLTFMFFGDLARALNTSHVSLAKKLELLGKILATVSTAVAPGTANLVALLATTRNTWHGKTENLRTADSLRRRRQRLDEELKQLKQRIVVFIDDVDRLEPDLMTLFFRMVRLNANFRNIIYVLAFDRLVVERHLTHDSPAFGREYLEKIIQVSYSIPQPHPRTMRHLLQDEMTAVRRSVYATVFDDERFDRLFDARRYDQMFQARFAEHFTTVRAIKRYVNALRLTLPPVVGKVDLVDFFVIELIRLCYPDIYQDIAQSKTVLLHPGPEDEGAQQRRAWLDRLSYSGVPSYLHGSLGDLLCLLFPDLRYIDGPIPHDEATRLRWGVAGRVCSHVAFDRFFTLRGERSQFGVDTGGEHPRIGGRAIDAATTRWLFERAARTGGIRDLLESLQRSLHRKELTAAEATIVADTNGAFDPRDDLQLADDQADYSLLGDVVKGCMKCHEGSENHFLQKWMTKSTSVLVLAIICEQMDDLAATVGQENAQKLHDQLRGRIMTEAAGEGLWDGDRWYYLMGVVRRLGREEEVLRLIERRVVSRNAGDGVDVWNDGMLLKFCEVFPEGVGIEEPQGGGGGRTGDIRQWLPDDAEARLQEVAKGEGSRATRAKAVLEGIWKGTANV